MVPCELRHEPNAEIHHRPTSAFLVTSHLVIFIRAGINACCAGGKTTTDLLLRKMIDRIERRQNVRRKSGAFASASSSYARSSGFWPVGRYGEANRRALQNEPNAVARALISDRRLSSASGLMCNITPRSAPAALSTRPAVAIYSGQYCALQMTQCTRHLVPPIRIDAGR